VVRAGGAIVATDSSGRFLIPPGSQHVQVMQGSDTHDITEPFQPGQLLTVEWRTIAPVPTPGPVANNGPVVPLKPPPPDPAELAWEAAKGSLNRAKIQAYLNQVPDSPHAAEARALLESLNREEQKRLDDEAWNRVNQTNEQDVRRFAQQNPYSLHQPDAQAIVARFDKQKLDAQNAENAKQAVAIHALLNQFNAVFERGRPRIQDLKQVWPNVPPSFTQAMSQPGTFVMNLRSTGDPIIAGNTAVVPSELTTTLTNRPQKPVAVNVQLRYEDGAWHILDLPTAPR
jgi:hypothetical protein